MTNFSRAAVAPRDSAGGGGNPDDAVARHPESSAEPSRGEPSQRKAGIYGRWILGLLLLGAIIAVVVHAGDLHRFAVLASQSRPAWLLVGAVLQAFTYVAATAVWFMALRAAGADVQLRRLLPLGLVKLFADQSLPSSGVSGAALVFECLQRRGVSPRLAVTGLLVSLVSRSAAYLLVLAAALLILWPRHDARAAYSGLAGLMVVLVVAIPTIALCLRRFGAARLPGWIPTRARNWIETRLRARSGIATILRAAAEAPVEVVKCVPLQLRSTAAHVSIFLLDATTLWAMLQAIGIEASWLVAFPALVMANVVAALGMVPLGLGIGVVHSLGVPIEASLTATLLLRGLSFWLPMLPGMVLTRRELSRNQTGNADGVGESLNAIRE
jgi:uncharacterized protein (TIRG00374 family)